MPGNHPRRSPKHRTALTVLVAAGVLVLGTAPAGAEDPKPLEDAEQQVQQTVDELLQPSGGGGGGAGDAGGGGGTGGGGTDQGGTRLQTDLPLEENDDSAGHETADPAPPDHGSAQGLEAQLAGEELVEVAGSDSEVQDDHSSSADATALAIGGREVVGSHADSDGDRNDSDGNPLQPVCEGSDGGVCASVLYSEAHASEGETTSDSSAESGVASACLGGSDPSGDTCDGPVQAGLIESWSSIHRDGSGHTEAESGSSVADICLGSTNPLTGACDVGVEAVRSEGRSDSRGTAEKESQVVALEIGGEEQGSFEEPTAIAVPPGCTSPSLACVFLNQGETYLGRGIAGHAVEALHVSALDGNVLAHAAQSETLVHQAGERVGDDAGGPDGPKGVKGDDGTTGPAGGAGPGDSVGPLDLGDDLLPATGGFWSGLLAIGLLAVALGAFLIAWARRRELVDGTA